MSKKEIQQQWWCVSRYRYTGLEPRPFPDNPCPNTTERVVRETAQFVVIERRTETGEFINKERRAKTTETDCIRRTHAECLHVVRGWLQEEYDDTLSKAIYYKKLAEEAKRKLGEFELKHSELAQTDKGDAP